MGPQSRRAHPSSAENSLQEQPFLQLPATLLIQMPFIPDRQDHTGSNLQIMLSQPKPAPEVLEDDADKQTGKALRWADRG